MGIKCLLIVYRFLLIYRTGVSTLVVYKKGDIMDSNPHHHHNPDISVNMDDAYALSILGQVPRELQKTMYDQYIAKFAITDETRFLIESRLHHSMPR